MSKSSPTPRKVERVAYELEERCRYVGEYYASRGYVVVGQNVRGRFASEGEFVPFRDDGWSDHLDGYDTILWAGGQAWSNGAVGMFDGSYSGSFQRFQRSSSFKQGSITSVLPPSRETCVSVAHMQLSCPVHCPEQDRTAIFSPILLNGRAGTVFGVCILEVADRFLLAPQKHPVAGRDRVFLLV